MCFLAKLGNCFTKAYIIYLKSISIHFSFFEKYKRLKLWFVYAYQMFFGSIDRY